MREIKKRVKCNTCVYGENNCSKQCENCERAVEITSNNIKTIICRCDTIKRSTCDSYKELNKKGKI